MANKYIYIFSNSNNPQTKPIPGVAPANPIDNFIFKVQLRSGSEIVSGQKLCFSNNDLTVGSDTVSFYLSITKLPGGSPTRIDAATVSNVGSYIEISFVDNLISRTGNSYNFTLYYETTEQGAKAVPWAGPVFFNVGNYTNNAGRGTNYLTARQSQSTYRLKGQTLFAMPPLLTLAKDDTLMVDATELEDGNYRLFTSGENAPIPADEPTLISGSPQTPPQFAVPSTPEQPNNWFSHGCTYQLTTKPCGDLFYLELDTDNNQAYESGGGGHIYVEDE